MNHPLSSTSFAAGLALALASTSSAQSLKVTGLTQSGNQITITVQNTGGSTGYRLEGSPGMAAGTWNPVTATFAAVPGQSGFFRTTITRPGAGKQFYRIVGLSGTTEDTDGDGLSNTFETTGWRITAAGPLFTSDPAQHDTDNDGFNDGMEFVYGTDPRSAASKPDQALLPSVEFAAPLSSVTEGAGVHQVELVVTGNYTGTVRYRVNARSTAAAPADYTALSGSVNVPAGSRFIPVTLNDNAAISPERLLVLELDADPPGGGYRRGGQSTHVICLGDNDGYWNGVLRDAETERNFRVRILRSAGSTVTTAEFVSGTADGLARPAGVSGSQSEGVIPSAPQNIWAGTGIIDTGAQFHLVSPAMPAGVTGTIAANANLQRTLTLNAQNPAFIDRNKIIAGTYSEVIASGIAGKTYLNRTTTGMFTIVKDLPAAAVVPSELQP